MLVGWVDDTEVTGLVCQCLDEIQLDYLPPAIDNQH